MYRGDKENLAFEKVKLHLSPSTAYGYSSDEFSKIKEIINNARPNEKLNDFPDFTFENGFIEHFQVTSSKETRKGAKHIKEKKGYEKKLERIEEKIRADEINSTTRSVFQYSGHSYESFKLSFEKNWESHMKSLKKQQQSYRNGIFMIEYLDKGLAMLEKSSQPKHIDDYLISRDADMLKDIQQYQDMIQHIIFLNQSEVELLSMCQIGNKKKMPLECFVMAYQGIQMQSDYFISVND